MFTPKSIIKVCIAWSIVFLPIAQAKVVLFGIPLYSVEIPVLVALGAYLFGWWQGTIFPLKNISLRDPLLLGASLFFLGAILSFVSNPFSLTGLGMLKTWFFVPLLMAWLWRETMPEKRDTERILLVWLGVTVAVSLVSLWYLALGIYTYDGRLSAWFSSPNYLAIFIAPGILISFSLFQKSLREKYRRDSLLLCISSLILFVVLFFTHSYGVWLGVLGGVLFIAVLPLKVSMRKNYWGILFLAGLVVTIFFSFEQGSQKWQSLVSLGERSSLSSRMMIWQSATKMIVDKPLLGIGIGRFQEIYLEYQKYYPPYLEWAVPQPHNLFLAVWLQTGLVGLAGFVLLIASIVSILLQNKNQEARLLLGFFVLYFVYGLFDTPFFKTDLAFIFWLIIGVGAGLVRK